MEEKKQQAKGKFLRVVSPKLYLYLTSQFSDQFNIHPYDIRYEGIEKEDGVLVILRYGEDYIQMIEYFFTFAEIDEEGEELTEFVEETGEICQEVMIADYYKMMDL